MKKILFLLVAFVFVSFIGFSQNNDSTDKQVKKIEKRIIVTADAMGDEDIVIDTDGAGCNEHFLNDECGSMCSKHMKIIKKDRKDKRGRNSLSVTKRLYPMSPARKAFALMPVFLFLFVFLIFLFWLRRENYKLSDSLSSKTPQVIKVNHSQPDPNDPSKMIQVEKEEIYYPRSASKLIAFFTAITGIIVVICGISYHAYALLSGIGSESRHHMGGILIIAIILFIGMTPYIFRTMFKK